LRQEAAVHGTLLAAISPANTPHGYNWTFAFPMLLFIVVAAGLYLRFRGPHRVPGHVSLASSRWASGTPAASAATAPPVQQATAAEADATVTTEADHPHESTAQQSTEDGE
jgi:hypothetical protein